MKLRALSAVVAAFVVVAAGAVALDLELSPYKIVNGLSGPRRWKRRSSQRVDRFVLVPIPVPSGAPRVSRRRAE